MLGLVLVLVLELELLAERVHNLVAVEVEEVAPVELVVNLTASLGLLLRG